MITSHAEHPAPSGIALGRTNVLLAHSAQPFGGRSSGSGLDTGSVLGLAPVDVGPGLVACVSSFMDALVSRPYSENRAGKLAKDRKRREVERRVRRRRGCAPSVPWPSVGSRDGAARWSSSNCEHVVSFALALELETCVWRLVAESQILQFVECAVFYARLPLPAKGTTSDCTVPSAGRIRIAGCFQRYPAHHAMCRAPRAR